MAQSASRRNQEAVHPLMDRSHGLGVLAPHRQVGLAPPPFSLGRKLRPHASASRWLARRTDVDELTGQPFVVYQLAGPGTRVDPRTFLRTVEPLRQLSHRHLLPLTHAWVSQSGSCHLACPYAGNGEGLLTLERLLRLKPDGRLTPIEGRHLLRQALSACVHARENGLAHGPITPEELLIDPKGSVMIELYGFSHRLNRIEGAAHRDGPLAARETRSLLEIAARALSGHRSVSDAWDLERHMLWHDRPLAEWLANGLSNGYASPSVALASLPRLGCPADERRRRVT